MYDTMPENVGVRTLDVAEFGYDYLLDAVS